MPTYEEVLSGLEAALDTAAKLGLEHELTESRFLRYRDDLQALIDYVRVARQGQLTPELIAKVADRRLEYVAALSEGQQFGDIIRELADADPAVLKPKLRVALRGPALPSDEDPNSNHARNILFELALAARLKCAGLQTMLGDRPDVSCEVDGKRLRSSANGSSRRGN